MQVIKFQTRAKDKCFVTSQFWVEMTYKYHGYSKSIGHFTDVAFVKRMQMFNAAQLILEKVRYFQKRCFIPVYQSCCQNRVIREINYAFDHYMFVFTKNRQGFDILLPTILNEINIYDSSSSHKKYFIVNRELPVKMN